MGRRTVPEIWAYGYFVIAGEKTGDRPRTARLWPLSRELLDPRLVEDDVESRQILERVGLHHTRDAQITHGTTRVEQGNALPKPP